MVVFLFLEEFFGLGKHLQPGLVKVLLFPSFSVCFLLCFLPSLEDFLLQRSLL